jgi:hypothetical protein
MTESTARLTNGQRWSARHFVDHYFRPSASGVPTPVPGPPAPVDVDRSWYMDEGPGRYYHPGMFPVMHQILNNRNLAPGTYDLKDFVPNRNEKDPLLSARVSNYTTDIRSDDYLLRALVFGNESATISGKVGVDPNGSKTFKQVEIRPWDTNFDFDHNTVNIPLEAAREVARRIYDPEEQGVSYQIQYRAPGPEHGTGRIYDTFSDSQLNAALRKEFINPGSAPPWLLPSVTGKAPLPFVNEHREYLGQPNGSNAQASASAAGVPTPSAVTPVSQNSSDGEIGDWVASLAGVARLNPTQSAPPPLDDDGLRNFYRSDPAWLLQLRR